MPRSSARISSESPPSGRLTSPSIGVTFERMKSSNASPCLRRSGANGAEVAISDQNRSSLVIPFLLRTSSQT